MTNAEKFQEIFKEFATEVWAFPEKDFLTWLNTEYKEPTTKNDDLALIHTEGLDEEIRCTMCTNYMKSDRGCDGSCVVNKDMYKAVMDAIEKRIQLTPKNDLGVDAVNRATVLHLINDVNNSDEFKDYSQYEYLFDQVDMMPSVTPEELRWVPVSERLPEKSGNYWCIFGGTNLTGSDYYTTESDAKEIFNEPEEYVGWRSQNVIAWMPSPQPYGEVEE